MINLAEKFLHSLFGDGISELDRILIWTAPAKLSFYASVPAEAIKHVDRIGQRQNIYFGCGLVPRNLGLYERAKPQHIRGIPGIWADIDVINPKAHNKTDLPPSIEDAIVLAETLPLMPTLIVLSGHGIQPWWLFKEPWLFSDAEERDKAADAVKGWQNMLKGNAAARGWGHDATHDLSRVLRLPGTFNIKDPYDIREVTVTNWNDSRRYNPQDLEGYLIDMGAMDEFTAMEGIPEPIFVPRRGIGLPIAFVTGMNDDKRLAATWSHKRKDMKDSSYSGYDMALARMMAGYKDLFEDQDIADVIAAHRDVHCAPNSKEWNKGHDRGYIARTIKRARAQNSLAGLEDRLIETLKEENSMGEIMEEVTVDTDMLETVTGETVDTDDATAPVRAASPEIPGDVRAKKLAALSVAFRVKIIGIRRYLTEPPQYEIILPWQTVKVGDVSRLISQTEFRKVLAGSAGVMTSSVKPKQWTLLCQAMLDCVEDVDVGEEGTDVGMVRQWLVQYLEENKASMDDHGACRIRQPFKKIKDGKEQTYIFLEGLRTWLTARQERYKPSELAFMLRRYGCKALAYKIKVEKEPGVESETTKSVYLLP